MIKLDDYVLKSIRERMEYKNDKKLIKKPMNLKMRSGKSYDFWEYEIIDDDIVKNWKIIQKNTPLLLKIRLN